MQQKTEPFPQTAQSITHNERLLDVIQRIIHFSINKFGNLIFFLYLCNVQP